MESSAAASNSELLKPIFKYLTLSAAATLMRLQKEMSGKLISVVHQGQVQRVSSRSIAFLTKKKNFVSLVSCNKNA